MKKTLTMIMVLAMSTMVACGGETPKATISKPCEEIMVEEIRVENIKVEEIEVETIEVEDETRYVSDEYLKEIEFNSLKNEY